MTDVKLINDLGRSEVLEAFIRCCGAKAWAEGMVAARPYRDANHMFETADALWWKLSEKDWLEAFSHHPKIGDVDSLRKKFASTATWASGEQSGVSSAAEATLAGLAEGNKQYEDKFGYIFIVCATGKSADEMLALLRSRLPNNPKQEIKIAATEQSKITRIRLEKLCQEAQSQPTC